MSNKAPFLDQATLKRLLTYDQDTGAFRWHVRADVRPQWNGRYAGKIAGYQWNLPTLSYWSIRIFDWPFLGHRLAWLYMIGQWPEHCIDHIDLDGLNNRWINLRAATQLQNLGNTRRQRTNTTGFKGVARVHGSTRFRAQININCKQKLLGHFATAEEAHAAYQTAARIKYGEFARFS